MSDFPSPMTRRQLLAGAAGLASVPLIMFPGSAQAAGPGPAQPAAELILPDPPPGGIPLAQIFETYLTDRTVYQDRVYFVWSSVEPQYGDAIGCVYVPVFRDPDRAHDLAWYRANHPDWVAYMDDRVTPAYPYTYPNGNPMPLDMANPEVREWWFDLYVQPWIDRGFPVVGFDNGHITNAPTRRAGHYDSAGNWVQQFSGEVVDPAFIAMVLDWFGYLRDRLHAAGVAMAANIGTPPSWLPRSPVLVQGIRDAIDLVDIWVDEAGFTSAREANVSDEAWLIKHQLVREASAQGVIHVSINYPATRHLADASQEQLDWATANFLLAREQASLLALRGQGDAGHWVDCDQLQVDLGVPTAPPALDASGAWTRPYRDGLVLVNPSSTDSATAELDRVWWDIHGRVHRGSAELPANSALILQRGRRYPEPRGSDRPGTQERGSFA